MPQGVEGLQLMQAKQEQMVADITRWLSAREWSTATIYFACAANLRDGRVEIALADGSTDRRPMPEALEVDFAKLRAIMVAPGAGTWFSTLLVLQRSGDLVWDFNNERRVYFGEPDPFVPPPEHCEIVPADWVWKGDLERYPRSPDALPDWASDLHEPEYADRLPENIVLVLKGFDSLAPVKGVFLHGLTTAMHPEAPFFSRGIVATSRDVRIATENFTVPQVAIIVASTARDLARLSAQPEQQEVVVRLNTWFQPLGEKRLDEPVGDLVDLLVLEEIVAGRPRRHWHQNEVDDILDTTRRLIVAGSLLEKIAITAPGKFTEEIS